MKSFLTKILIAALTLLGVFVKDFPGRETAASAIIARISEAVYSHIVSPDVTDCRICGSCAVRCENSKGVNLSVDESEGFQGPNGFSIWGGF